MIIKCADLIKEDTGRISIGGCNIDDTVEQACKCLNNYAGADKLADGVIISWLDVDLMWPRHVLKDLYDAKICCYYDPSAKEGIKLIKIEGNNLDLYPYTVIAEIEEKFDEIARNSSFAYTTPHLNPDFPINYISIKSSLCEMEFIWRKKNHPKDKTFEVIVGPCSENLLGTLYEKRLLLNRIKRKLTVELGKYENELSKLEIKDYAMKFGLTESE